MKKKKLWITVAIIALLAPSLVLCFLILQKSDVSLNDFAEASSFSLTDAEGKTTVLQSGEDSYALLRGILSLAENYEYTQEGGAPSRLYTVKTEDGKNSCRVGLLDGRVAVLWNKKTYLLDYPRLQAGGTVMYPCLVRYGIEAAEGYIDAPLLSQGTETIYSFHSLSEFREASFDAPCESLSLEIFLYEQGAQTHTALFHNFDEIFFDEACVYTVVVNAEATMGGYRVQCGYELFYSPEN